MSLSTNISATVRRSRYSATHRLQAVSGRTALVLFVKAKFHYAIWSQTGPKLVADLQRAGIWPII